MKCLERNKQTFYYCLFKEKIPILDEYANETGQEIVVYEDPVMLRASISPASGQSITEQFGNLENYDKVIVTDWMDCPIDENSVLFIDKAPEFTEVEYNEETAITTVEANIQIPVYDYVVRRVAKSLNVIRIAVSKVKVS